MSNQTKTQSSERTIRVENKGRDPKFLPEVWKTPDGSAPPTKDKDGKPLDPDKIPVVESYQLALGSQDDLEASREPTKQGEAPVLSPIAEVPEWVAKTYRKRYPVFDHWINKGEIVVNTPYNW